MKKLYDILSGECFGELELLDDLPLNASIKCLEDCHLLVMEKKRYIKIFKHILNQEIKNEVSFYPEIEFFSKLNYNKIK